MSIRNGRDKPQLIGAGAGLAKRSGTTVSPHSAVWSRARASGAPRWPIALAAVLTIAVGVFIPFGHDSFVRPVYLTVIGILCVLPIAIRALQRRFDPFEPIFVLAVGAFFIWFLRPLSSIVYSNWWYGNGDIRAGFNGALLVVLVGLASTYLGYIVSFGSKLGRKIPAVPDKWDSDAVFKSVLVMLVFGGILFAMFMRKVGGFHAAFAYFSSRQLSQKQAAASSTAWFYLAPYITIPSALICLVLYMRSRRRRDLVAAIFLALLSLAITVPKGDRTYVIMIALPLFVLPYLRIGRRPSTLVVVVGLLVAVTAMNLMVEDRVASRRHGSVMSSAVDAMTHPARQLRVFLTGSDISMFSSLAETYEVVPREIPFKPGNELLSTLALPVPRLLWQNKPHDGETDLFPILFPQTAAVQNAGFGPSMVGGFYIDSGFVGVIVYMFAFGIGLRMLFEYRKRNSDNLAVLVVYAACLPMIILMMRGSVTDTAGRSVYLLGPYLVAFWYGRHRLRVRSRRRTSINRRRTSISGSSQHA